MKTAAVENIYELTPLQQGMLFHSLYTPDSAIYNIQMNLALDGDLSERVMQQAWRLLVERHAPLRTSFVWERVEKPYQVVQRHAELEISRHDWRISSAAAQDQRLCGFLKEDRERLFDLTTAPLMRMALIVLSERKFHLIWTFHHIILEGWSAAILLAEFWKLYTDLQLQKGVDLPPVRPYADYIHWLQSRDQNRAKRYWRQKFKGFHTPPRLPIDRSMSNAPAEVESVGACSQECSNKLTQALQNLGRSQRVTLNTVVQGAWSILLSRYTGESDVAFGAVVSGRPADLPGAESTVGLFVNTLPARVKVSGEQLLMLWLRALQLDQAAMREYEYSSLMQVQAWSELPGGQPLFHTVLGFENWLGDLPSGQVAAGLQISDLETYEASDQPLSLFAVMGDPLKLTLMYDSARFDAADVQRMLSHFRQLLESIAAAPHARISELSLLTEGERQQIVYEWNRTGYEYAREVTIPAQIEAQAEAQPKAPAVVFGGRVLDYGELNERANRLAYYLKARGVVPDVPVAVLMERTPEMVITLLAVLKAGGAYLPLDPETPSRRLSYMLQDAGTSLLLTQSSLLSRMSDCECRVVCVDRDWPAIAQERPQNPGGLAKADNLAYIIYTSGSTGEPKGVEICHGSLSNLVAWHRRHYEVTPADRATHLAGLGFDASVWELWPYLSSGASLYLVPEARRLSPAGLWEWLAAHGITLTFLPTPLAEAALREPLPQSLALRAVLTGGDRLHGRLTEAPLPFRLVNHYGPTENTVVATCTEVNPCSPVEPAIGYPIDNVRVYILDAHRNPAPVGVAGELYIGGDGVARGYLNRPELTAEKFVPDPFADDAEARLYRTGDRVRYRDDGAIEFLGRFDHQVKIRGFRIELGEVEAALGAHDLVQDAVVLMREDETGDRRLVGYVVLKEGEQVTPSEIKHDLGRHLPDYMLPSVLMVLDELPLNANGKVNREALPAPEATPESETAYAPPRTAIEEALVEAMQSVLNIQRVGIHDSFFELGGHSLMATRVASKVRELLQVELPLMELFRCPTVAALARVVDAIRADDNAEALKEMVPVMRSSDLPLSFAQERLWFLDQLEPDSAAYNIPMVLNLKGVLDVQALHRSLQAIVDRHETLRTTFIMRDGHAVQRIAEKLTFELPLQDAGEHLDGSEPAKLNQWVSEVVLRPFDLGKGPLIRARLLRLGDEDHLLLLTMHHIASDGWSMGILFRELGALYGAFVRGQPLPLQELRVQYADFAVWQRDWFSGEVQKIQLDYWREKLNGLPALDLPSDRPRPAVQTFSGALEVKVMPKALGESLQSLGHKKNATLFMTMLSAFSILLYRYSGQQDIVVGSPIANRRRAEIEDLIGFFVNTLVMRIDVSGAPTFYELLDRVRDMALGAYKHQDLPFERLVDELQPDRDRSRNPLFQVLFTLQNAPLSKLTLEGLTLDMVPGETHMTRFDLEVHLWQGQEGLTVSFLYNTDLFDAETIQRMMGHYQRLLEGIVADSGQCIHELPLLPEAEQHLMVNQWNRTIVDYPSSGKTLHERFEAQVVRTPEQVAVVFDGHALSYRELNRRANRIAHYLQKQGVGSDSLVGIFLERGLAQVEAVLGVLKAGGGYVPLDPEYPRERLGFMLEDSSPAVVLTQSALLDRLPANNGAGRLNLDAADELLSKQPDQNPQNRTSPDHVAYVIFTSGSTGRPKGIVMEHGALCNLIDWQIERSGESGAGRTLQFASLSFDVSFQEMFSTWCAGGTLVLIAEPLRRDPASLLAFLDVAEVNRVFMPFAGLAQMAEAAMSTGRYPDQLREVITAGEQLQITPAVENLFSQLPGCTLDNQYGPSEAHVVTAWRCDGDPDSWPRFPPIGRPIGNASIYLLDRQGKPAPIGVPGELYIGGKCLAREYLGQPGLTAEVFVSSPFDEQGNGRLYKTGDLARYRPDGNIEYVGRTGSQVKLRGYRVELGEIETVLMSRSDIQHCVVIVREDRPGDRRLVAYVVGEPQQTGRLRSFLKEKLPEYMIPSVFVTLESLPLTPSGKLNRRALPAPTGERQSVAEYVLPSTGLEHTLVDIWKEILGVERVGVDDNFFELGGHSLMAMQIVSRLRDAVGVEAPVATLFASPTVQELAASIEIIQLAELQAGEEKMVEREEFRL